MVFSSHVNGLSLSVIEFDYIHITKEKRRKNDDDRRFFNLNGT